MSLTISIRFLTGRAHLHPWQTHHSEGRVDWPPSPWRLLRAIVAVAGRGLTSLPYPDEGPPPKPELVVSVSGMSSLKKRGVSDAAKKKLSFSKPKQTLTLNEPLTDSEADAFKAANTSESFSMAIDQLRNLAATPVADAMRDVNTDPIPLLRLAALVAVLSPTPTVLLPKTSGGHTRQYFPIHEGGIVKNTGSTVFDTFAVIRKDQPLLFHWSGITLNNQQLTDLKLILGRMTYFGRAESWCLADAHATVPELIPGVVTQGHNQSHWRCVCIEDAGKPNGLEYRDYTLERRLTALPLSEQDKETLPSETIKLLPRTKIIAENTRPNDTDAFRTILQSESPPILLLRCLLRESGQDIKDGLDRPIGTRWAHYAVPRTIYDLPRPKSQPRSPQKAKVNLVRFALNTATVHRAVLPPLTDTLLVADRFRNAALALCRSPARNLSGHELNGDPCRDHQHAFYWPTDEDDDGFIDHVTIFCPAGFEMDEVDTLCRLHRLRQRGGRPDLLVTPVYIGASDEYLPWMHDCKRTVCFTSATPYFCPLHLSPGRGNGSKLRPITLILRESLRQQGILDEVEAIEEIVFDYSAEQLVTTLEAIGASKVAEPVSPRQFFPVVPPPKSFPPLPRLQQIHEDRYRGAFAKDPDSGYAFGLSVGLLVDRGTRFIRALSFCRRRRHLQVKGYGRMFLIRFKVPRPPRPFALGDQCHFGLGMFVPNRPTKEAPEDRSKSGTGG